MDKDTTKSTLIEVLNQISFEKFNSLIKETGADKYFVIRLLSKPIFVHKESFCCKAPNN